MNCILRTIAQHTNLHRYSALALITTVNCHIYRALSQYIPPLPITVHHLLYPIFRTLDPSTYTTQDPNPAFPPIISKNPTIRSLSNNITYVLKLKHQSTFKRLYVLYHLRHSISTNHGPRKDSSIKTILAPPFDHICTWALQTVKD